jgi:hypothetical protein
LLQAQVDRFGPVAVRTVLATLGDDLFSVLRQRLYSDYDITLTDDSLFTLEELQIALQRLLGDSAVFLMREIKSEILNLEFAKN